MVTRECLDVLGPVPTNRVPLLLCIAEPERPGRLEDLDDQLIEELQAELGVRFHPRSATLARGHVGGAIALEQARRMIAEKEVPMGLIVGVDSYLREETLEGLVAGNRLLSEANSDGFIPAKRALLC